MNGKEETVKEGGRLGVCIRELRGLRREVEAGDEKLPKVSLMIVYIDDSLNSR